MSNEIVLNKKLEEDVLYLNKIFNNGLKVKYLYTTIGTKFSDIKKVYDYLEAVYNKEIENRLNLSEEFLNVMLRKKRLVSAGSMNYKNYIEAKKTNNEELIKKYKEFYKNNYYRFWAFNLGYRYSIIYKENRLEYLDLFKDRKSIDDSRFDVGLNRRELELLTNIIKNKKAKVKRNITLLKSKYDDTDKQKYIEYNDTHRNLFYEQALILKEYSDIMNIDVVSNLFKKSSLEKLTEDRIRKDITQIKFRVCKKTMNILRSISEEGLTELEMFKILLFSTIAMRYVRLEEFDIFVKCEEGMNIERIIPCIIDEDKEGFII
jgi:hypothetical protein